MKYFKQFSIILVISFLGELLHIAIPLPIPASIYGLVLMLIALSTKIVPLASVKETGNFLIDIMPLTFIPGAVRLMTVWGVLRPMLLPILVIMVVTTFLVMAASGTVTQLVIRQKEREKK